MRLLLYILSTLVTVSLVILTFPFQFLFGWGKYFEKLWGGFVLYICGLKLLPYEVPPEIKETQPCVLMSNHESAVDSPLYLWVFPAPLHFAGKHTAFWVPFFGLALWINGHIPVNRGNREKAIKSMKRAARMVQKGKSVIVFPEGQRAENYQGEMLPFKKGGFMLAIEAGAPIVPAAVAGTGDAIPKGSYTSKGSFVCYRFGKPIETKDFSFEDRDLLMEKVRNEIEKLRQLARKDLQDFNQKTG